MTNPLYNSLDIPNASQQPYVTLNQFWKTYLRQRFDDVYTADFTSGDVTFAAYNAGASYTVKQPVLFGTVLMENASAPRDLNYPPGYTGQRVFVNMSGQTITVQPTGGTGVAVPNDTVVGMWLDGTNATSVGASLPAGVLLADGSVPMAADLDFAGFLPINLGTAMNPGDAVSLTVMQTAIALAVTGLLDLKGGTDCSGNPNYPAASKGDAYYVTVAGKIGGASGTTVDVGDVYAANADNAGGSEASVGTSWFHLEHNLVGAALLAANNVFTGSNEFDGQYWSAAVAPTDGPNITVDWSLGNVQRVTIAGNRTLNFSNMKQGGIYTMIVTQDGSGSRLLGYSPAPDFWIGGVTPTLPAGAGEVSIFTFWYANSVWYGMHQSSVAATPSVIDHNHTATGDGGVLTNDEHAGYIQIDDSTEPGTTTNRLYAVATGILKWAGQIIPLIATTLGNSQVVETDGSGNLISAAKGTAYNKNFGTGSTDVTPGDAALRLAGGTMTGNIAMGTHSITGMADPVNPQDADTQAARDAAIATAVTGVQRIKGSTDCSANPNYPAAVQGDAYYVSVAGKIGGALGVAVSKNDLYFAIADNAGGTQLVVGASWDILPGDSNVLLAVNNLSDVPTPATARTNLGLAIGTNVQAYNANLTTWAGKTAPSGTVVGNSDTQTLTNKTLTTPIIGDFTSAGHDHSNAAGGGTLALAAYPTFVASGASHAKGAVPDPGASAGTAKYLREDATWAAPTGTSLVQIAQTVVGGGGAASVTFSSISNAYTDLELSIFGRTDNAVTNQSCYMQVGNGSIDTGNNYYTQMTQTAGTSSGTGATLGTLEELAVGRTLIVGLPGTSATAGNSGAGRVILHSYASTTFHKAMSFLGGSHGGTGSNSSTQRCCYNAWLNTAAIDTVKVFPSAGNFAAGTIVTLWGRV